MYLICTKNRGHINITANILLLFYVAFWILESALQRVIIADVAVSSVHRTTFLEWGSCVINIVGRFRQASHHPPSLDKYCLLDRVDKHECRGMVLSFLKRGKRVQIQSSRYQLLSAGVSKLDRLCCCSSTYDRLFLLTRRFIYIYYYVKLPTV